MPVGDPPPAGAGASHGGGSGAGACHGGGSGAGASHGGGSGAGASHGGGSGAALGDYYTTLCCTKCSKPPAASGRCRLNLSNPS